MRTVEYRDLQEGKGTSFGVNDGKRFYPFLFRESAQEVADNPRENMAVYLSHPIAETTLLDEPKEE